MQRDIADNPHKGKSVLVELLLTDEAALAGSFLPVLREDYSILALHENI